MFKRLSFLILFIVTNLIFSLDPFDHSDNEFSINFIKKLNSTKYEFEDGFGAKWFFFVAVNGKLSDSELAERLDLTIQAIQECVKSAAMRARYSNNQARIKNDNRANRSSVESSTTSTDAVY
ncbi:hypothetical protein COBT_002597 [Conglomerata obtusa]